MAAFRRNPIERRVIVVAIVSSAFAAAGPTTVAGNGAKGHAYQVNVLIGDGASQRTVDQALHIVRTFDLRR